MDPEIKVALLRLAQSGRLKVSADGAVWDMSRRAFRFKSFEEAKQELLGSLLRCFGRACLVLLDYDRDTKRRLSELGAHAGPVEGFWTITHGIDTSQLDRVALYLGNWHLFAAGDSAAALSLRAPCRLTDPRQLVEIAKKNAIGAIVVSDTDDDRWLVFFEDLDTIKTIGGRPIASASRGSSRDERSRAIANAGSGRICSL